MRVLLGSFALVFFLCAASAAEAGCCWLVKVDSEIPMSTVRACSDDGEGNCGSEIFSGSLSFGESVQVCTTSETLVYQEWDDEQGGFGPPISAVCDGGEVEL